jgi:hypothetical protein
LLSQEPPHAVAHSASVVQNCTSAPLVLLRHSAPTCWPLVQLAMLTPSPRAF